MTPVNGSRKRRNLPIRCVDLKIDVERRRARVLVDGVVRYDGRSLVRAQAVRARWTAKMEREMVQ